VTVIQRGGHSGAGHMRSLVIVRYVWIVRFHFLGSAPGYSAASITQQHLMRGAPCERQQRNTRYPACVARCSMHPLSRRRCKVADCERSLWDSQPQSGQPREYKLRRAQAMVHVAMFETLNSHPGRIRSPIHRQAAQALDGMIDRRQRGRCGLPRRCRVYPFQRPGFRGDR